MPHPRIPRVWEGAARWCHQVAPGAAPRVVLTHVAAGGGACPEVGGFPRSRACLEHRPPSGSRPPPPQPSSTEPTSKSGATPVLGKLKQDSGGICPNHTHQQQGRDGTPERSASGPGSDPSGQGASYLPSFSPPSSGRDAATVSDCSEGQRGTKVPFKPQMLPLPTPTVHPSTQICPGPTRCLEGSLGSQSWAVSHQDPSSHRRGCDGGTDATWRRRWGSRSALIFNGQCGTVSGQTGGHQTQRGRVVTAVPWVPVLPMEKPVFGRMIWERPQLRAPSQPGPLGGPHAFLLARDSSISVPPWASLDRAQGLGHRLTLARVWALLCGPQTVPLLYHRWRIRKNHRGSPGRHRPPGLWHQVGTRVHMGCWHGVGAPRPAPKLGLQKGQRRPWSETIQTQSLQLLHGKRILLGRPSV